MNTRSSTARLTVASLTALAALVLAPTGAFAATKNVYHDQPLDCSSSYHVWDTVYTRSSPGGDVKLKLTNNVGGIGLRIRLVNTSNVQIADTRVFKNEGTQVVARSVVRKTRFKLSTANVCDLDGTWAGKLSY